MHDSKAACANVGLSAPFAPRSNHPFVAITSQISVDSQS